MKSPALARAFALVTLASSLLAGQEPGVRSPARHEATLARLPIYFVENRGVYPEEVVYFVEGADKTLFFTQEGITFRMKGEDRDWVVKLEFVGANPGVIPRGEKRQDARFSYFRGPRDEWKTGLRAYGDVVYAELWPGIDLVYSGTVSRLKYAFVVNPGADPARIRLRYRGAESVTRTAGGALRVATPSASFEDARPEAWQVIEGARVPVETAFRLDVEASDPGAGTAFGFRVGEYDPTRPLIVDPAVVLSCGYIGGSGTDFGRGVALDAAGNMYVAGNTQSNEQSFPVKVGPALTHKGGDDAFVAKVNAQGTALIYCGYIGGSGTDIGYGIGVDGAGNAYVAGHTNSNEQTFPVTVGPDVTYNGGAYDGFVAKVNPQGTALVYCGYVGGSGMDSCYAVAVDAGGNAYLTGRVDSNQSTFPVTVGPDLTHNGFNDGFAAKVNAQGTGLVYCGYIGGSSGEHGKAIAVDASGAAYVAGHTQSTSGFPVKVGPDLTHNLGKYDAWVAKVNAQGTGLDYCGYIGGNGDDRGKGIAVDAAGSAYVTGHAQSSEQTFPVAGGPDLTFNGVRDAFVAKVDPKGAGLLYCGYIGGSGSESGAGIAVDAAGNAYVAGNVQSDEKSFPVTGGPDLTFNGGTDDAFVAKVGLQGTGLVYCGYIGGSAVDLGTGITRNAAGRVCTVGYTQSTEQTFPVAVGPDLNHNGADDVFVARVSETSLSGTGTPQPGGQVKFTLSSAADAGLPYYLGSSFGNGPIPIDTRRLELSPDSLLALSVSGLLPAIFSGYAGLLDGQGQATAALNIPNAPGLKSIRIYTAFLTLKASAPSGVASISNTFMFTIQ